MERVLLDRGIFRVGDCNAFSLPRRYAGKDLLVGLVVSGRAYVYVKRAVAFGSGSYVGVPAVLDNGGLKGQRVKVFVEYFKKKDVVQSICRAVGVLSSVADAVFVVWDGALDRDVVLALFRRGYLLVSIEIKSRQGSGTYYIYEFVKKDVALADG